ncbi:MAG: hypothetical protein JG767_652 [Deferribacteraceae bacterium]|jgi:molybdate/tungstate transport system substrate-binding protein|nr:hypothetical protein [Deferribacteraceae bacterium]
MRVVLLVLVFALSEFIVVNSARCEIKINVPEVFIQSMKNIKKQFESEDKDNSVIVFDDDCTVSAKDNVKKISETAIDIIPMKYIDEHMSNKSASEYAFFITFATDRMVLAYTQKSKYSTEINRENWPSYLRKSEVKFGLVSDFTKICNVRQLLALKLSQRSYLQPNLYATLYNKSLKYSNVREIVEASHRGDVDYFITYRTIAIENGLNYIELPDMASLSNDCYKAIYNNTYVEIPQEDGSLKRLSGDCIYFSIAVKKGYENDPEVTEFLNYFLGDDAKELLESHGFYVGFYPEFRGDLKKLSFRLRGLVNYAGF